MRDVLGRRLIGTVVLLGALVWLDLAFPEQFPVIVSVALVISLGITWTATYYFTRRSSANPTIRALRERAQTSFLLAVASTVGGILGALVIGRAVGAIGPVPRDTFLVGLGFALILIAGPAANGLVTWQPWKNGDPPATADEIARRIGNPPEDR